MSAAETTPHTMSVEVVIPVLNEEKDLPVNVPKLHAFLSKNLPNPWRIVVADNGSTDRTRQVSEELCRTMANVGYIYLPQRGRGIALRTAWSQSTADIVSYMDVDLSTEISYFPKLIQAIEEGADIAIGSRLKRGAVTTRSTGREITSRGFNGMQRVLFQTGLADLTCGFKALRRDIAMKIVPLIKNNHWFFDQEMLIIGKKRGCRIAEIPVVWVEDPGSTVNVVKTITEDLKGLARLRFGGIPKMPLQVQPMPNGSQSPQAKEAEPSSSKEAAKKE